VSGRFNFAQLPGSVRVRWVDENCHLRNFWDDCLEQLQAFCREFGPEQRHASDVPAGAGKADYEPIADGIATTRHHDRDRTGGVD
jgi:hypothetical protein